MKKILLVAVLLVLCLYVGVLAAEVGSYLQTKPDWGENGLTVIYLGDTVGMGIRIDGSYLVLL
jgi:hypothetical protein